MSAYQAGVPTPLVLCIGRGVDADKAASCLDISFKSIFLVIIKQRIVNVGGVEEHDCRVMLKRIFVEVICVLSSVYGKAVLGTKLDNRLFSDGNR